MLQLFTLVVGLLITLLIFKKSFRFYIFSFFFYQLYHNPRISRLLGIQIVDTRTWKGNRDDTVLHVSGLFTKLFEWFTGMGLTVSKETMTNILRLQGQYARLLNMESYFAEIDGKTLTLRQFENFLSQSIIKETNAKFSILNRDQEAVLLENIEVVLDVVNGMSGGYIRGFYKMFTNFGIIMKVSGILKSVGEAERLLIFGPQLSLIDNFSKMLVRQDKPIKDIQVHDFLKLTTKFFVFEHNGQLTFSSYEPDTSNFASNKAFGPGKISCPGASFTVRFIESILVFLQSLEIRVDGEVKWKGTRFRKISNKEDIQLTFKRL